MFKCFPNFLTKKEFDTCGSYLSGWEYTGISNQHSDEYVFWAINLIDIKFFTEYIFSKILAATGDTLVLDRVYANGQTYGQPGKLHKDSEYESAKTFLIYTNKIWQPDWGGGTAIINENSQMICPYIPNNAIYFDGNIPHCGLEPTRYCKDLRTTIAFKMTKV